MLKLENIYVNRTYLDKNPSWHTEDSKWKSEQIIKIIRANNIEFRSLKEIGCGFGEIIFWLSKEFPFAEIYGYDIADAAIEAANKKFIGLQFQVIDELEEVNTTDICLIIDVIEHIDDYYTFLSKIKGKSKYFIFHIPLDISVKALVRSDFLISWDSVGHIHFFTSEIAKKVIEKAGFRILDTMVTKAPIELLKSKVKKRLLSYVHRLIYTFSPQFAIRVLGGYSLLILAKSE